MFNFFKKKSSSKDVYEAARKQLSQKTGYFVATTLVVRKKSTGDQLTIATQVVNGDDPLQFNPTFLPTKAQYVSIVMNEKVRGLMDMDTFAQIVGADKKTHTLNGIGDVEFFVINADPKDSSLTYDRLTGELKQLQEL